MDYKKEDIVKIERFIALSSAEGFDVADVERSSGADKLRVLPILYDMYLSGKLLPLERSEWGIPTRYRLAEPLQ